VPAVNDLDQGRGAAIASRAVVGSAYSVGASLLTLGLGFARSVLLARLLLPEQFGVVSLALFFVGLVGHLRSFGLDQALIHRQELDDTVLGTYFSARVGTLLVSLILLVAVSPLLARYYADMSLLPLLILALAGVELLKGLSTVQETLLSKNLAFPLLALTDVVASGTMTVVAPLLAWRGWGAWALVAEQGSGILARFAMTWLVFRSWWPRLAWDPKAARWFWGYGRSTWAASNLGFLLDRFDDFWVGTMLGRVPLGYYSRAYEFARYPRRVIANPLVSVFGPVFARLQGERQRLSQAFFRSAHIILRSGFFIAGAFALLMPEFIRLVIGEQWLPMLLTFRLMLVYTLLDALLMLCGNLLLAVGRPDALWRSRLTQFAFFVPAVIAGSFAWGINGVALAADSMLLIGGWVLYRYVRQEVDFSLTRLAFWPLIMLVLAWIAAFAVEWIWVPQSFWLSAVTKLGVFAGLYVGPLLVIERGDYAEGVRWLWRQVRSGSEMRVAL
jgi:O-antigen/teichoic acid export membrane protein